MVKHNPCTILFLHPPEPVIYLTFSKGIRQHARVSQQQFLTFLKNFRLPPQPTALDQELYPETHHTNSNNSGSPNTFT